MNTRTSRMTNKISPGTYELQEQAGELILIPLLSEYVPDQFNEICMAEASENVICEREISIAEPDEIYRNKEVCGISNNDSAYSRTLSEENEVTSNNEETNTRPSCRKRKKRQQRDSSSWSKNINKVNSNKRELRDLTKKRRMRYKAKNVKDNVYEMHIRNKNQRRDGKQNDKEKELHYYKQKLVVYNFTIFNLATKDGYCFV
ncbi:hypothetical protein ILUMI_04167 [Ignelater luminosus]|uniref:Uncharacterized protein n=1 Tax=Ignelater luminosus TaxID=2038154 RepID=A0A8K0DEV1_IGNLU|nr:hypothetical protein ILUMI_04167 [Ignelater luminosus]